MSSRTRCVTCFSDTLDLDLGLKLCFCIWGLPRRLEHFTRRAEEDMYEQFGHLNFFLFMARAEERERDGFEQFWDKQPFCDLKVEEGAGKQKPNLAQL